MSGLVAELKTPLKQRANFADLLAGPWTGLSADQLATRPVELERDGPVSFGEVFHLSGSPDGSLRLLGKLDRADAIAAGLTEGIVVVEGDVGAETGMGMAGGILEIQGNAGPRAGAAPLGFKRGMTGGELIVHGSAGEEAGSGMRRGLLAIGKSAGARAGLRMIAGSVIVFGAAGPESGLWSKRGSIVALGKIVPPDTYLFACTYQPVHLRVVLTRLRTRFQLPVRQKHLTGLYRRYSGDLAELGRGEILEWTAK
jgi:formylmethanofuran dehydrogenase subunit C